MKQSLIVSYVRKPVEQVLGAWILITGLVSPHPNFTAVELAHSLYISDSKTSWAHAYLEVDDSLHLSILPNTFGEK